EQHPIAHLDRADVVADGQHLGPDEPGRHLGSGRDDDAARRAPLALLAGHPHENAVVQHLDRQAVGHGSSLTKAAQPQPSSCSRSSSMPKWWPISWTTVIATSRATSSSPSHMATIGRRYTVIVSGRANV